VHTVNAIAARTVGVRSGLIALILFGVQSIRAQDGPGSIVAWGSNTCGQCNVPPAPNSRFIAVAAGLGLQPGLEQRRIDRSVGDNALGQCDIPTPNTDFVSLGGHYDHGLGVKTDGSVVAWDGTTTASVASRHPTRIL